MLQGAKASLESELLSVLVFSAFDINSASLTHCRWAVGGMISCVCLLPYSLRKRWLIRQTSGEAAGRVPKQQVRQTGEQTCLVDVSRGDAC